MREFYFENPSTNPELLLAVYFSRFSERVKLGLRAGELQHVDHDGYCWFGRSGQNSCLRSGMSPTWTPTQNPKQNPRPLQVVKVSVRNGLFCILSRGDPGRNGALGSPPNQGPLFTTPTINHSAKINRFISTPRLFKLMPKQFCYVSSDFFYFFGFYKFLC